MSDESADLTTREARQHFSDVVADAIDGKTTYVTQRGRRRAAVVPVPVADARRHAEPSALANAAEIVLTDNGKTMPDFLDACLTAVATNPKPFLAALAKYWPKA
jgi:prevent-host-death family protein